MLDGFNPATIAKPALRQFVLALMHEVEHLHATVRTQAAEMQRLRDENNRLKGEQDTLDFADALAQHGRRRLYLRLWLDINKETVSQQTVFFTAPRFLDLRRAPVHTTIRTHDDGTTEIAFSSPMFQHRVAFDVDETAYRASDNFLYPNVPHRVLVRAANLSEAVHRERLLTRSLVDSY